MTDSRIIPWKTIAVEAVAIVLSILLAFAIDAWWTEKKESEVEYFALLALRDDFIASSEQMERVILSLESAQSDFSRFKLSTATELSESDLDTNRRFLTALVKNHTFDPVSTTLDALSNDGRLGLLSDAQLLQLLSRWHRELDNIDDISFELRAESVRVRRAMERHGGPFSRWLQRADQPDVLNEADGDTMASLWRDAEFMGTAMSHQYALAIYLHSLRQLADTLDSISVMLEQITTSH
jgi:hypothetical protein